MSGIEWLLLAGALLVGCLPVLFAKFIEGPDWPEDELP